MYTHAGSSRAEKGTPSINSDVTKKLYETGLLSQTTPFLEALGRIRKTWLLSSKNSATPFPRLCVVFQFTSVAIPDTNQGQVWRCGINQPCFFHSGQPFKYQEPYNWLSLLSYLVCWSSRIIQCCQIIRLKKWYCHLGEASVLGWIYTLQICCRHFGDRLHIQFHISECGCFFFAGSAWISACIIHMNGTVTEISATNLPHVNVPLLWLVCIVNMIVTQIITRYENKFQTAQKTKHQISVFVKKIALKKRQRSVYIYNKHQRNPWLWNGLNTLSKNKSSHCKNVTTVNLL